MKTKLQFLRESKTSILDRWPFDLVIGLNLSDVILDSFKVVINLLLSLCAKGLV